MKYSKQNKAWSRGWSGSFWFFIWVFNNENNLAKEWNINCTFIVIIYHFSHYLTLYVIVLSSQPDSNLPIHLLINDNLV